MYLFIKGLKKPVRLTAVLLLVCGLIYPLVITGISQLIFPHQANGSLIEIEGIPIGSEIVGQDFSSKVFMKGRPSAVNYNTYTQTEKENGTYVGVSSGSNNYGATNPKLITRVEADIAKFLAANPEIKKEDIPTDLMTASGSGLDPHISPASAQVQIPALAKATGLSEDKLQEIVDAHTTHKLIGVFGEETVNVLKVNVDIAKEMQSIKK